MAERKKSLWPMTPDALDREFRRRNPTVLFAYAWLRDELAHATQGLNEDKVNVLPAVVMPLFLKLFEVSDLMPINKATVIKQTSQILRSESFVDFLARKEELVGLLAFSLLLGDVAPGLPDYLKN